MSGDFGASAENTTGQHAGPKQAIEVQAEPPLTTGLHIASEPVLPVFYLASKADEPFRQAEILSDVYQHSIAVESLGNPEGIELAPINHLLAIIVSQDCDLEQDFNRRRTLLESGQPLDGLDSKLLPNVLFCEVSTERAIDTLIRSQGETTRQHFRQNKLERYQFLRAVESQSDAIGVGVEAMGIDFKRYFTVPTTELYSQLEIQCRRRCRLAPQYLEHFSIRFSNYLSRVGLPKNHHE